MAITTQTAVKYEAADNVNILMRWPYEAVPMNIVIPEGVDFMPAGTPINADGEKTTGNDLVGILLHDIYPEMPVGAVVKKGYINRVVAEGHANVTYTQGQAVALPMVVFEPAIVGSNSTPVT